MPSESPDLQEIRHLDHTAPIVRETSDEYLEVNFIRNPASKMQTLFSYPAYYSPISPAAASLSDKYFEVDKETESAPLLQSKSRSTMYTDDEWATLACLPDADGAIPILADVENRAWAHSRSVPLAPQAPSHLGRYQRFCWYLSNRPRDSALAGAAVLIAIVATLALFFLVFILFMQMTGQMGAVMQALDNAMAGVHRVVVDSMCVFAGPECEQHTGTAFAAAA